MRPVGPKIPPPTPRPTAPPGTIRPSGPPTGAPGSSSPQGPASPAPRRLETIPEGHVLGAHIGTTAEGLAPGKPLGYSGARPAPTSAPASATLPPSGGNPAISRPGIPLDAQGRPYDLAARDLATGERIAHSGMPVGVEPGSPTHFQSRRNQLAVRRNEAHILHLTWPSDRGLEKTYKQAKRAEEEFARLHKASIKQEMASGHVDNHVPMVPFVPPRRSPPAGPGDNSPRPFHGDRMVAMDDMVNKAATALVNRPGPDTRAAYKDALTARTLYEKIHREAIRAEKASGAWNVPPIGIDHPEYRELRMTAPGTVRAFPMTPPRPPEPGR